MLRFQTGLQVDYLADEATDDRFEVIMPKLDLLNYSNNRASCNCSCGSLNFGTLWDKFSSIVGLTSYQPIVEDITFKPLSFKTETRRVRTGYYNVASDIEPYGDVSITMFCDANMLTQYYLSAWRSMVFNGSGEYFYPGSLYKKNIDVYIYGPGNIQAEALATCHFILVGCFPSSQDSYKLAYSMEPKRLTLTQTFKVDKVCFDSTKAYSSIIENMATSPSSLVDKAITNLLTNGGTAYSVNNVYT